MATIEEVLSNTLEREAARPVTTTLTPALAIRRARQDRRRTYTVRLAAAATASAAAVAVGFAVPIALHSPSGGHSALAPGHVAASATGVVQQWISDLGRGDTAAAFALMSPAAQAAAGGAQGFADQASAYAEGYGAWDGVDARYVPLTADGVGVVVLSGEVSQEGMTAERAAGIVTVTRDGASLIESTSPIEGGLTPPDGSTIAPDTKIRLRVPNAPEDAYVLVDGTVTHDALADMAAKPVGHSDVTFTLTTPLTPGIHSVVVVARFGDTWQVSGASYTVR